MAKEENKAYCYIKVFKDFFTNDTIDFIMSQENGSQYVALYLMLVLKTVNSGFALEKQIGEIIIPYDVKQIAKDSKYFDVDTVTVALELFKQLGVVYESYEDGTLTLAKCGIDVGNWQSMTPEAERKRRERERDKLSQNSHAKCPPIVTKSTEYRVQSNRVQNTRVQSTEKKDISSESATQILIAYHTNCPHLPKVRELTDKRIKALNKLGEKYSMETLVDLFQKAEKSDFLTGKSGKWKASFDWLINPNNAVKVLEGNYDNKGQITEIKKDDAPNGAYIRVNGKVVMRDGNQM